MKKTRNNIRESRREQGSWSACYCSGAGPRLTALMGGMCRGPFCDHFRTAGVELLLGLRAILDAQIEGLTRKQRKGTRVPVE